jgi:tetratricopeptide (TPR) repeat protein
MRLVQIIAGVLLLAAIGSILRTALYRCEAQYKCYVSEVLPAQAREKVLEEARALDPSLGWACWLLSKERLRQANDLTEKRVGEIERKMREPEVASNARAMEYLAGMKRTEEKKAAGLLEAAERLALEGTRGFNSIGCYKQLASIYLRKNKPREAERFYRLVMRVKPDDIESAERLALIKLNADEYAESEAICNAILRRHPYSANAYFCKTFVALKQGRVGDLDVNLRQTYYQMEQEQKILFDPVQIINMARARNLATLPLTRELPKQAAR